MVEDARKALAEGREPPMPLPFLNMQLPTSPGALAVIQPAAEPPVSAEGVEKLDALPAHLRTASTQVEPATPPKWMSYEEAEETVKHANQWAAVEERGGIKRAQKKERPAGT